MKIFSTQILASRKRLQSCWKVDTKNENKLKIGESSVGKVESFCHQVIHVSARDIHSVLHEQNNCTCMIVFSNDWIS